MLVILASFWDTCIPGRTETWRVAPSRADGFIYPQRPMSAATLFLYFVQCTNTLFISIGYAFPSPCFPVHCKSK